MGKIMIGEFSLGTVIAFVLILCVLLLPVAKICSMIRKKKRERRLTSDATVIDLAFRDVMPEEDAPAEDIAAADGSPQDASGETPEAVTPAQSQEEQEAVPEEQEETPPAAENTMPAVKTGKSRLRRRQNRPQREYFAAFRLLDGDRLEIELPGWVYKRLVIGDTGLLTYTDEEFVSFKWDLEENALRRHWKRLTLKWRRRAESDGTAVSASAPAPAPVQAPGEAAVSQTAEEETEAAVQQESAAAV